MVIDREEGGIGTGRTAMAGTDGAVPVGFDGCPGTPLAHQGFGRGPGIGVGPAFEAVGDAQGIGGMLGTAGAGCFGGFPGPRFGDSVGFVTGEGTGRDSA